jgi:hypothetical protein
VSDIDTGVVDGLKALDLERPIREAAFIRTLSDVADGPIAAVSGCNKSSPLRGSLLQANLQRFGE